MRIDINQKKIAIGDKYLIYREKVLIWKASTELFRLLPVIHLFKEEEKTAPVLTIRRQWSFMKPSYQLLLPSGQTTLFHAGSWWNMEYQCYANSDDYRVYGHRGRRYSVYRNGRQIAFWEKEAVTWFEGDNYSILADDDCQAELVIAFCLIIDNHKSRHHDRNAVSLNIGNIGGEVRPFDPYWKPGK